MSDYCQRLLHILHELWHDVKYHRFVLLFQVCACRLVGNLSRKSEKEKSVRIWGEMNKEQEEHEGSEFNLKRNHTVRAQFVQTVVFGRNKTKSFEWWVLNSLLMWEGVGSLVMVSIDFEPSIH